MLLYYKYTKSYLNTPLKIPAVPDTQKDFFQQRERNRFAIKNR